MAYKYKLVKELGPNTLSKIGTFIKDNPDTPLNEEEPLKGKFADLLARFKKEDEEMGEPKPDPNAKNTFKQAVKEMVMAKLKEGKPCWKGYEQIGMKEKDGRQVPNCVPKKR